MSTYYNSKPYAPAAYEDKMAAIGRGEAVSLGPAQFVLYVLNQQSPEPGQSSIIHLSDLSDKLNFSRKHLPTKLRGEAANPRDISAFSDSIAEKLAALSGLSVNFWKQRAFDPREAKLVSFDMSVDVSAIGETAHYSHAERLRRLRNKTAEARGEPADDKPAKPTRKPFSGDDNYAARLEALQRRAKEAGIDLNAEIENPTEQPLPEEAPAQPNGSAAPSPIPNDSRKPEEMAGTPQQSEIDIPPLPDTAIVITRSAFPSFDPVGEPKKSWGGRLLGLPSSSSARST